MLQRACSQLGLALFLEHFSQQNIGASRCRIEPDRALQLPLRVIKLLHP
jgi:hypothetical protein